jgi:hypothetical protein
MIHWQANSHSPSHSQDQVWKTPDAARLCLCLLLCRRFSELGILVSLLLLWFCNDG